MTVRVGIVGAGDVVRRGLSELLDHDDEFLLDAAWADRHERVDVIAYDAMGMAADDGAELFRLLATEAAPVVVIGRPLRPALAARAIHHGAVAQVSLESPGHLILETLKRAATGKSPPVVLTGTGPAGTPVLLSAREVQVLELITRGASNTTIGAELHLTLNGIKSIIRSAYRKIGATSRSQAVGWCMQQGFDGWEEGEAL